MDEADRQRAAAGTYGRIALDVSRSNPNVVYAQIEAGSGGGAARLAAAPATGAAAAAEAAVAAEAAGGGRAGAYDWCNNAGPGRGCGGGRGGRGGGAGHDESHAARGRRQSLGHFPLRQQGRRGRSSATATRGRCTSARSASIRSNDKNDLRRRLPVAKSLDGGKTFATLDDAGGFFNMGEDQHAIWIDPKNGNHIMRGNDGGLDISWDQGKTWEFVRTMATALAYWVTADMGHPYYVYTGLQDNDSWGGPSATRGRIGITNKTGSASPGGDGF